MTHTGAWLLAKDIRKFTTSADVACALFLGTDKVHILDRRGFDRDIYSMIDDVMTYILSKINVAYVIKHVRREERPELPEEALREAVVNALAHRDYRSTANVQIYIFRDRVEIVSPGGLPAGMTEADLGVKSIPRNPLLFGMLYRMDAVEHIGSGIRRIHDYCREYGVPEPRIQVSEHWFTIIFPRPEPEENGVTPFTPHDTLHDTPHETPHVRRLVAEVHGEMSREELMAALNLKDRMHFTNSYLRPALDAGVLVLTIPDRPRSRNQKYRLTALGRMLQNRLKEQE